MCLISGLERKKIKLWPSIQHCYLAAVIEGGFGKASVTTMANMLGPQPFGQN